MPVIAPWLESRPAEHAAALEAGMRSGGEARAQNIQAAIAAAKFGQDAAQQQADQAMQQQRLLAHQEEMQQQQAIEQEKIQATQAIAQQRNQITMDAAARRYQFQNQYQAALQGGMSPVDAMMQFGPMMGQTGASMGALAASKARGTNAALPPQFIKDDKGENVGVTYGGQFHALRKPAATVPKMSDVDKADFTHIQSRLKAIDMATSKLAQVQNNGVSAPGISAQARALRLQQEDLEKQRQAYLDKYGSLGSSEGTSAKSGGPDYVYDPKTKSFVKSQEAAPAESESEDESPDVL